MGKSIVLASASPRRTEILKANGIKAEIIPAEVDESLPEGTKPDIACMYNAMKKALWVRDRLKEVPGPEDALIIGADTIVYDGRILGKPKDPQDSFDTLSSLRNATHTVMTGVAVADALSHETRVFCERTYVSFGDYSDDEIRAYIATGEPADKAGSYAVQGLWSRHVTSVDGDYYNVIGLPWDRLRTELLSLGADI